MGIILHTDANPIYERSHPATTAGLLAALADGKAANANLKRGLCESCLPEGPMPVRKRLKVTGLELCPNCVVAAAVSL